MFHRQALMSAAALNDSAGAQSEILSTKTLDSTPFLISILPARGNVWAQKLRAATNDKSLETLHLRM